VTNDNSVNPSELGSDDVLESEKPSTACESRSVRLDLASAYQDDDTRSGKKFKIKRPSALTIQILSFFVLVILIQIASRGTSNSMSMNGLIFMYMVVTFFISIFRKKRNNSKEQ
jgi:hypothetical protein